MVFKKIKRKFNCFIGSILVWIEVYKNFVVKYDEFIGKYELLLVKEVNIKEIFWERCVDSEKEVFFLEYFYFISVYVVFIVGYYIMFKGVKIFIEVMECFKIIELVDMFINNFIYYDVVNFIYLFCFVFLNKYVFNSII